MILKKKFVSLLLASLMVLNCVPVFAAGGQPNDAIRLKLVQAGKSASVIQPDNAPSNAFYAMAVKDQADLSIEFVKEGLTPSTDPKAENTYSLNVTRSCLAKINYIIDQNPQTDEAFDTVAWEKQKEIYDAANEDAAEAESRYGLCGDSFAQLKGENWKDYKLSFVYDDKNGQNNYYEINATANVGGKINRVTVLLEIIPSLNTIDAPPKSPTKANQTPSVNVVVNGKMLNSDPPAYAEKGRTMGPLRAVADAFGFTVGWVQQTQEITLTKDGKKIVMHVGSADFTIDGKAAKFEDAVPTIKGGATFLPLRKLAEILGITVNWNEGSKTAIFSEK